MEGFKDRSGNSDLIVVKISLTISTGGSGLSSIKIGSWRFYPRKHVGTIKQIGHYKLKLHYYNLTLVCETCYQKPHHLASLTFSALALAVCN